MEQSSKTIYKSLNPSFLIVIIGILVVLDQTTKYIIKSSMQLGSSIRVMGTFFQITYVENPGMAFGLRFGNSTLFLILSLLAAALVFYYFYRLRHESWLVQLALTFISAGAIGNITDRFIHGHVIDFLDFEFFDVLIPPFSILGLHFSGYELTRWPVFNVADMAVSTGMIIIIAYLIFIGDPLKQSMSESSLSTSND